MFNVGPVAKQKGPKLSLTPKYKNLYKEREIILSVFIYRLKFQNVKDAKLKTTKNWVAGCNHR